jgi:ATP-dependent 26S proteasome regulatory subunit
MPERPSAERERVSNAAATFDAAADLLLQRAALGCRLERNRPPDPLAGLKVDEDDLHALLASLPGLEDLAATPDAALAYALAGPLEDARSRLRKTLLEGDDELACLVETACLNEREAEVLALLVAIEVDPRRQRLVGYLNDDITQRRPTLWTLGLLLGPSHDLASALGPSGGLRRACLLVEEANAAFASAAIGLAPSVLWWLAGSTGLDPALPAGTVFLEDLSQGSERLVAVASKDRHRRLEAALGALAGTRALVAPAPESPDAWDVLVRQATLAGAAVVVEVDGHLPALARDRIERAWHLAWAVTSPSALPICELFHAPFVELEAAPPEASPTEWAALLPDEAGDGTQAAYNYRLSADQLHDAARAISSGTRGIVAAVRRLSAGHLDACARRIEPRRTFDDLVLDEGRLAQVREVIVRHRRRRRVFEEWGFRPEPSTGVVALFSGPSGTGKTLAAEIVAGELGVDLYKVELANLVSKYLGETEKNLSRVFEAAEATGMVLFLDEADALLGKRSEVSDAHDRYANIEVAFLLQRLETYDGVAILSTNLASNLDPAFLRRLQVVVEFPIPKAPERRRIWEKSLPSSAPVADDLDLGRLAELVEVTGGTIRNAALRAGFFAAEADSAITMELALRALRRELEQMGRLANASEWHRAFEEASTMAQDEPCSKSTGGR